MSPAGTKQVSETCQSEQMAMVKLSPVHVVVMQSEALLGAPARQVSAGKLLSHHVLLPV